MIFRLCYGIFLFFSVCCFLFSGYYLQLVFILRLVFVLCACFVVGCIGVCRVVLIFAPYCDLFGSGGGVFAFFCFFFSPFIWGVRRLHLLSSSDVFLLVFVMGVIQY